MTEHASISQALLAWFAHSGRHNLPWQQPRTPYRVWVSEVMLQQTQIATVLPYFERFMQRFPSIVALAEADIDDVLHYWTGLGYYARARNLHKAAGQIVDLHQGQFPQQFDDILALPGIGRSTAGAIAASAFNQHYPILDGNVKRLLSRLHNIDGWPGKSSVEKQLWHYATQHTPQQQVAAYTQAIMDFGATLCTRSKPQCEQCPLQDQCQAFAAGTVAQRPTPKPRKTLPVRTTQMLMLHYDAQHVLLERRPAQGIWGGLWSLPEFDDIQAMRSWCLNQWGTAPETLTPGPSFRHTFSHYHLDITPVYGRLTQGPWQVMASQDRTWYNLATGATLGLAAPVKKLLQQFYTPSD